MEKDVVRQKRRSSYFFGCLMSQSCFVVHDEVEYTRIHSNKTSRRWRYLLRRFVRKRKISFYGSKPNSSFQYDAVSYSLNFDDGFQLGQQPRFQN